MPKPHGARQTPGSSRDRHRSPPSALAAARQVLAAGEAERALDLCDAYLLLHPADPEALHLSGSIALRLGRIDKAIARLRQAAMQRPRDAALLGDFGRALEAAGNRDGAETAFRAALTLQPDLVDVQFSLGRLLERLARDDQAAQLYESVVTRQPRLAEAHSRLARVRLRLMMPLEALAGAEKALALKPEMIDALLTMGSALDALGRCDEAVVARQAVIRLRPQSGGAWYDLGMTQMHHGRMEDAAASFRAAIALEPDRGAWHRALAFLVGHRERDAEIETMDRLQRSNSIGDDDRMHVCFGLGKALDDLGAFDEAFGYFLEGNRLKRKNLRYSSEETDRLFDKMKEVFTAERFAAHAGSGSPDETPIFVLGMPRSGTSLVEQVLASHPDVQGGGEFRLLNQLVGTLASGPGFPLGEALDGIEDGKLRELGETYIAHVRGLSTDARFVTDKLPGNFIMIGMIKLLLPNARIIHCQRDPVDTCLSIFKNYFAAEHLRYAYDLAEIGHYHLRYLDLMAHWQQVLPGFVYDISYEALIADFDGEAKKLVAHCGLDWRDECRQFFNTRRSVQTASSVQIRKPIYNSSIGQAARYGHRIDPLLRALGR